MAKRKKTLFGEAKYNYLAKIISMKDPSSARKSVTELKKEFNGSKTRAKKLRIYRATVLAENRAKATRNKKNLSSKEKSEFLEISKIYGKLADYFAARYHNLK